MSYGDPPKWQYDIIPPRIEQEWIHFWEPHDYNYFRYEIQYNDVYQAFPWANGYWQTAIWKQDMEELYGVVWNIFDVLQSFNDISYEHLEDKIDAIGQTVWGNVAEVVDWAIENIYPQVLENYEYIENFYNELYSNINPRLDALDLYTDVLFEYISGDLALWQNEIDGNFEYLADWMFYEVQPIIDDYKAGLLGQAAGLDWELLADFIFQVIDDEIALIDLNTGHADIYDYIDYVITTVGGGGEIPFDEITAYIDNYLSNIEFIINNYVTNVSNNTYNETYITETVDLEPVYTEIETYINGLWSKINTDLEPRIYALEQSGVGGYKLTEADIELIKTAIMVEIQPTFETLSASISAAQSVIDNLIIPDIDYIFTALFNMVDNIDMAILESKLYTDNQIVAAINNLNIDFSGVYSYIDNEMINIYDWVSSEINNVFFETELWVSGLASPYFESINAMALAVDRLVNRFNLLVNDPILQLSSIDQWSESQWNQMREMVQTIFLEMYEVV